MKTNIVAAILLSGVTGIAGAADCNSTLLLDAAVTLNERLVCGSSATNSDTWQEEHQSGGDLWERARGASDPIDHSRKVGTWSGNGSTVTYNYTGGSSFTFSVYADNASPSGTSVDVAFCNGNVLVATAIVRENTSICP